MKGVLISFEGIDFCGKSVQIEQLIARLKEQNIQYLLVREPGGTIFAEKIRDVLLTKEQESMSARTEFLLYSAARAQLTKDKIIPALKQGSLVICDRYFDSSTAYQGYGRGIDLHMIDQINLFATEGVKPNLTILIDIDLEEMERRKRHLNKELDRMEEESKEFFNNVRNGFLAIAGKEPERFVVIDGKKEIHTIAEEIWHKVEKLTSNSS